MDLKLLLWNSVPAFYPNWNIHHFPKFVSKSFTLNLWFIWSMFVLYFCKKSLLIIILTIKGFLILQSVEEKGRKMEREKNIKINEE